MNSTTKNKSLLTNFEAAVGDGHVLTDPSKKAAYCKGFRYGDGDAIAVILPGSLLELWEVAKLCVAADVIMIVQAANTGVTGGSTPNGDYDRDVVIINTMRLSTIHPIADGKQVIAFPGSRLYELEQILETYDREPHSVIGSSCIGASVIGGVCNNSGGALIQRGPAYTELSLYAQIDADGQLHLVNHLGVDLGKTPEEILTALDKKTYSSENISHPEKLASDNEYQQRVRDVDAQTPSRFNHDKRRLFEASGCAGKLIVFAVRLDTFEKPKQKQTFYIGANDTKTLTAIRRHILTHFDNLPISGEYLHQSLFDICDTYGKDQLLILKKFGSEMMPKLFKFKRQTDAIFSKVPFAPKHLADRSMQLLSKLFPDHLPKSMREFRQKYEHHLILTLEDDGITEAKAFLPEFFAANEGDFFLCDDKESQAAMLHRFVAAGAAARYQTVNYKKVGELMSLDIALRRNDPDWFEVLPPELDALIDKKLYCAHFFCHVMHQDYIVKKGVDPHAVKAKLLKVFESRGAEYPAEHNVGTLYTAKPVLKQFYKKNDPTNTLNPGIGKTTKRKNWVEID